MKKLTLMAVAISVALTACSNVSDKTSTRTADNRATDTRDTGAQDTGAKYAESWDDLAQVDERPKWFQDAKFGIYTHWGPVSTANIGLEQGAGWYGLMMYMDEAYDWKNGIKRKRNGKTFPSGIYKQHTKNHGHPSKVGYKDIIKKFNPSQFDAELWAELFAKSGAKFAGPVAMHHDNFAMWDSEVTRWNVKDFNGIDVTGELKTSIEKRGMKFLASFHHAFTWVYYANAYQFDATEETADLYTDRHALTDFKPSKRFHDEWYAKLVEVVDKYQPEVIWFDWWVEELDEEYRKKFIAYYYNKGAEWGKDVVVSYKNTSFPSSVGVYDYERGRPNKLKDEYWMTDTSPGAWFYRQNAQFVEPNEIIDILIDIVSKNGLMLLNVPPNPDGSIPQEMQDMLLNIGQWLNMNGEGIYETRPWKAFGEGPTRIRAGGHKVEKQKIAYTDKDIRFTRKGDNTLYMFVLDKPQADIIVKTLSTDLTLLDGEIDSIEMLGSGQKVHWQHNSEGLVINKPHTIPNDYAVGYKINLKIAKEIGIGGEDDPQ
ncbi:alpha-L-fucosidase [Catenovulum sediminis]|uniref:alpha-L-fucosidase n=1 Tax=Catenovulum sediminis TaxID=1740262 RepID=A0ABV1RN74_9ALTE|nr:alpha-L-fucosidase [Catenovulum sediminis]